MEVHDVQRAERRNRGDEQRRDDGEVLRDVVGDGEGRERAARHQQLFADLDDLDQLRGVVVQVDHVARLLGGLRAAVHGHAHVGLRQRRGVVRAVAHHGHQLARLLFAADVFELVLGTGLGDEVVDAGLLGDVFGRQRIVARDHHGLHAHPAQPLEAFADARLDDVLQLDDARDPFVFADYERCAAVFGDGAHGGCDSGRAGVFVLGGDAEDCFGGSLADAASVGHVDARTLGFGGEFHHPHADHRHRVGADPFGGAQLDDGFAFGGRVGDGREHAHAHESLGGDAVGGMEARGLAVADGDGAGLVQEQRVDVAGGLDGLARLGDDVGLQGAVHAGDADGRQQAADGGRDQADEQRDERRDGDIGPHIVGEGLERGADDDENEREPGQQDRQRDFVGRLLARGAFDQGDHPVEETLAGPCGDFHENAVGEDLRAARDGAFVAARLADHRGRFARDGAFVDRRQALDDLAVGGDGVARDALEQVALLQFGTADDVRLSVGFDAFGGGLLAGFAQRVGLRPAAGLGDGLGEVGEEHR